jgi:hypothetical protein
MLFVQSMINQTEIEQQKTPVHGYTGVYFSSEQKQYYITLGSVQYFNDVDQAALAHDEKALQYFGCCAILNYPDYLDDYRMLYAA